MIQLLHSVYSQLPYELIFLGWTLNRLLDFKKNEEEYFKFLVQFVLLARLMLLQA